MLREMLSVVMKRERNVSRGAGSGKVRYFTCSKVRRPSYHEEELTRKLRPRLTF